MTEEIWKDIAGFEGLYQVSNLGNVRSLNYARKHIIKNLTPHLGTNGYLRICFHKRPLHLGREVHRLVAEAFLPNQNNLPQVNHIDENRLNNRVENLEWCSCSYNANYGSRNLKMKQKNTALYGKPVMYIETGEIFESMSEASKRKHCNPGNISNVCNKRAYRTGGYHWKLVENGDVKDN